MPGSKARAPSVKVLVNGVDLPGVEAAEVVSCGHYAADRFRISAALTAADPGFWSSVTELLVEIRFSADGAEVSAITGEADSLEIDPLQGIVKLEGRDLSARLIEARTSETFANRTASEIASLLASRHELSAAVVPTTTPVGRYYQSERDQVTLDQFSRTTTEWELLTVLGQIEGYDVWVNGSILYFMPAPPGPVPVLVNMTDCLELRLERALTLARDIEVTVKSWSSHQQQATVQTARASGTFGRGRTQQYVYVRPNLMPSDAARAAARVLADISRHERVASILVPGDLTLSTRDLVCLSGTGTDFDTTYRLVELERRIDWHSGYLQRLRLQSLPAAGS